MPALKLRTVLSVIDMSGHRCAATFPIDARHARNASSRKSRELSVFYCTNVNGFIKELKPEAYKGREWRLFIDSFKRSLKAVLLHNTN